MPRAPLYSPYYFRWALHWSERQSLSPPHLLAAIGAEPSLRDDPGKRVPGHLEPALLEALPVRLGDGALWARMAREATPGELDLYGLYLSAAGTVAEALRRAVWAHRHLPDTHRILLRPRGSLMRVRLEPVLPDWDHPATATVRLGALLGLVRAVGGEGLHPEWVRFKMPPPADRAAYERLMGAPVRFNQPADEMALDIASQRRPGLRADPNVSRVAYGHLVHHFGRQPRPPTFPERVFETLDELVRRGEATVAETSERLGMAPRTLQHHLKAHGTTFRALLDARRRDFARELLVETNLNVDSVAERAGFSDVRSLQKAFQRWNGCPPQAYRKLALDNP